MAPDDQISSSRAAFLLLKRLFWVEGIKPPITAWPIVQLPASVVSPSSLPSLSLFPSYLAYPP